MIIQTLGIFLRCFVRVQYLYIYQVTALHQSGSNSVQNAVLHFTLNAGNFDETKGVPPGR